MLSRTLYWNGHWHAERVTWEFMLIPERKERERERERICCDNQCFFTMDEEGYCQFTLERGCQNRKTHAVTSLDSLSGCHDSEAALRTYS